MFNELLDNYRKKMELPYFDENGERKYQDIYIKPLSLNDMMWIMDDQVCAFILVKMLDGIDIKTEEGFKSGVQRAIINPDYIKLFYSILACCITINSEEKEGSWYSLRMNPKSVELLPLEFQTEALNIILDLSMPVDIKKFTNQVKKLQTRLISQ